MNKPVLLLTVILMIFPATLIYQTRIEPLSKADNQYDEPKGIFPCGKFTFVESNRETGSAGIGYGIFIMDLVQAKKLNESPVWEPFLYLDKHGNLFCYYSDEQNKTLNYNQLLCHKLSKDGGKTWGETVLDVAVPDNKTRPGIILDKAHGHSSPPQLHTIKRSRAEVTVSL